MSDPGDLAAIVLVAEEIVGRRDRPPEGQALGDEGARDFLREDVLVDELGLGLLERVGPEIGGGVLGYQRELVPEDLAQGLGAVENVALLGADPGDEVGGELDNRLRRGRSGS